MLARIQPLLPFFLLLFTLAFLEVGVLADDAEARSRAGGRSFSSPASRSMQQQSPAGRTNQGMQQQPGSFGRGLMGGLVGGALGGLLFGSMFGMGGSGMGILPLILLGAAGYFFYKRFVNRPRVDTGNMGAYRSPGAPGPDMFRRDANGFGAGAPPVPPIHGTDLLGEGLAEIRSTDPGFDEKYFLEVASDVFFKVQAGWMRRDIASYRHLLGDKLASEYERHFEEMKEKGVLNKLENIAIRNVEILMAGSQNGEDFVTVLFTANLLDYTVDEKSGAIVEGSNTEPVKFVEEWTWARPIRTENWKLEHITESED